MIIHGVYVFSFHNDNSIYQYKINIGKNIDSIADKSLLVFFCGNQSME